MEQRSGTVLVEIAKPITLCLSILSLYAVFHAAFLVPGINFHDRIWNALTFLALSACIAFTGGLFLRAEERQQRAEVQGRLTSTLPVRVFLWATAGMVVLFSVSWYLETYCIFYRDVRF